MLSGYKHENLISLLGFCDENGEKILVYEHASHGSLDRHLSSTTLTWRQRLNVCLGAAMGLCYLHDPKETQQRVLHRDVKSSNILLDENWNAKVSDMGLSKIGPANQKHTFLVSNVVGTFGYIDPMYMDTSILTKESDVYSFGVVLFEVLCGKLCFEYNNGHLQSLVQMWKKSYKQKKLDEIIFTDLKQHMDPSSLETFSDIAYQCLHKSREERPKMSHVVEKLEIALGFQAISEEVEPQMDYEEIVKSAVHPIAYESKEELKMFLSKGILVNEGKTWFWLNKNGEHCEMISTAKSLIPIQDLSAVVANYGGRKSRFAMGYFRPSCLEFKAHVRTQFLSPHITYAINLVFCLGDTSKDCLGFTYLLAGETKSSTSYFADKREDGWLTAELYQFTTKRRNVDLEITFKCSNAIAVEGIEFQPLESGAHEVVVDEEVDMELPDTYWEQKLPSDYQDIIKSSKDSLQWTTKKELYFILCKGFPLKREELHTSETSTNTFIDSHWFSLAKNGKKCHLLPARKALRVEDWVWQSLRESRFEEVASGHRHGFRIDCVSEMLSPQTTYASYLVYKLQERHPAPWPPMKVKVHINRVYGYPIRPRYAYLVGGQTPILRSKDYQKTHNAWNRPKMEGLPQLRNDGWMELQDIAWNSPKLECLLRLRNKMECLPRLRNDGWMEVQVWEFRTGTRGWISEEIQLTFLDNNPLEWVFMVEGIEFKPISVYLFMRGHELILTGFLIYDWG